MTNLREYERNAIILANFMSANKRLPYAGEAQNIRGRDLASWLRAQWKAYKSSEIELDALELLDYYVNEWKEYSERLFGPKPKIVVEKIDPFYSRVLQLKLFIDTYKRLPDVGEATCNDGPDLRSWVDGIRQSDKKHSLKEKEIRHLDLMIPLWREKPSFICGPETINEPKIEGESREETFRQTALDLADFISRMGRLPNKEEIKTSRGRDLYDWMYEQRERDRANCLRVDRKKFLNACIDNWDDIAKCEVIEESEDRVTTEPKKIPTTKTLTERKDLSTLNTLSYYNIDQLMRNGIQTIGDITSGDKKTDISGMSSMGSDRIAHGVAEYTSIDKAIIEVYSGIYDIPLWYFMLAQLICKMSIVELYINVRQWRLFKSVIEKIIHLYGIRGSLNRYWNITSKREKYLFKTLDTCAIDDKVVRTLCEIANNTNRLRSQAWIFTEYKDLESCLKYETATRKTKNTGRKPKIQVEKKVELYTVGMPRKKLNVRGERAIIVKKFLEERGRLPVKKEITFENGIDAGMWAVANRNMINLRKLTAEAIQDFKDAKLFTDEIVQQDKLNIQRLQKKVEMPYYLKGHLGMSDKYLVDASVKDKVYKVMNGIPSIGDNALTKMLETQIRKEWYVFFEVDRLDIEILTRLGGSIVGNCSILMLYYSSLKIQGLHSRINEIIGTMDSIKADIYLRGICGAKLTKLQKGIDIDVYRYMDSNANYIVHGN